LARSRSTN